MKKSRIVAGATLAAVFLLWGASHMQPSGADRVDMERLQRIQARPEFTDPQFPKAQASRGPRPKPETDPAFVSAALTVIFRS